MENAFSNRGKALIIVISLINVEELKQLIFMLYWSSLFLTFKSYFLHQIKILNPFCKVTHLTMTVIAWLLNCNVCWGMLVCDQKMEKCKIFHFLFLAKNIYRTCVCKFFRMMKSKILFYQFSIFINYFEIQEETRENWPKWLLLPESRKSLL